MPMKEVTLHRWQIVASFVLLGLVAVAIATWNDHRIDLAEERITRNSARSADLAEANRRQDMLRAELLKGLLHADEVACFRIEELKTQNRLAARSNFEMLDRNLELLGLTKTPEIVAAAETSLRQTLDRNRPSDC